MEGVERGEGEEERKKHHRLFFLPPSTIIDDDDGCLPAPSIRTPSWYPNAACSLRGCFPLSRALIAMLKKQIAGREIEEIRDHREGLRRRRRRPTFFFGRLVPARARLMPSFSSSSRLCVPHLPARTLTSPSPPSQTNKNNTGRPGQRGPPRGRQARARAPQSRQEGARRGAQEAQGDRGQGLCDGPGEW